MKLLVTGAGGFLGAAIVQQAVKAGLEVVAVARSAEPRRLAAMGHAVQRHGVDMRDRYGLRVMLATEAPDVVVHSAWAGLDGASRASSDHVELNLVPTCHFVEDAAAAGVSKFIGIGSQGEYGSLQGRVTENATPAPTSFYGAAKLAACHLGRAAADQAGMAFAWMRLFATFGPGDNPNWLIPSLTTQMLQGKSPKLTPGTQRWDYLFIDDAATGVLAAAQEPAAQGVFNLSSGSGVPVRSVVERLRDIAAPGLALRFGEIPFGPNQIMHMEGDNRKLIEATGWRPSTSLDRGLRLTVDAIRAG